jgi:flagellar motor switch protein FliG
MNGIKKSAKFLSGLDWNTTAQLLDRLDSDTAKMLRREIMSVRNISIDESDQLAVEFLKAAGYKPRQNKNKFATETFEISSGVYSSPLSSRGVNGFADLSNHNGVSTYRSPSENSDSRIALNRNIYQSSSQLNQSSSQLNQSSNSTGYPTDSRAMLSQSRLNIQDQNDVGTKQPLEFLFNESPVKIAEAICRELPQTIAVVIAALPDSLANEILLIFPPSLRQNIGRRLAEIKISGFELADDSILFEIESKLKQQFNRRQNITFEELERLDDTTLINLFRSVDLKTSMFALVGANPRFIERITKRFTPTEESIMRKLLRETGTVDEINIEKARKILTDKVSEFFANA